MVEHRQASACCGDGSSRHHASVRAVHGASHGRRQGQHRRRPAGRHRDRDRRRRCQARGLDIAGRLVHGVRPPAGQLQRLCGALRLSDGAAAEPGGGRRRHAHRRLHSRDEPLGGDHGHRHEARGRGQEGSLLLDGDERRDAPHARGHGHRGHSGERGRLHRAEPGPGPEPGGDARRVLGTDRARPAGRQGASRRLSRRVTDLDVPVHAGPRSFRHQPRRGPPRPPRHPLRRRLRVRHGSLHHQPAQAGNHPIIRRAGWKHDPARQPGGKRQVRLQRSPGRDRSAARVRILQCRGGLHRLAGHQDNGEQLHPAGPHDRPERREHRQALRRARRGQARAQ